MKHFFASICCGPFLLVAALGCSDDASEDVDTKKGDDSSEAKQLVDESTPDAGGSDSSKNSSQQTDTTELPDNVKFVGDGVVCGEASCQDVEVTIDAIGALTGYGCCVDEDESSCGIDLKVLGGLVGLRNENCDQLDAPGLIKDECPESIPIEVSFGDPFVFEGCCQPSGKCGYFASIAGVGFGCVAPDRFSGEAGELDVDCSAED